MSVCHCISKSHSAGCSKSLAYGAHSKPDKREGTLVMPEMDVVYGQANEALQKQLEGRSPLQRKLNPLGAAIGFAIQGENHVHLWRCHC
jgi:hypothetical protein